jgi:uncharacterized protein GlcG (DUF336 family)
MPRPALSLFTLAILAAGCSSDGTGPTQAASKFRADGLPTWDGLRDAVVAATKASPSYNSNGGLALNMWATVVDRTGTVVAVVFTGDEFGDQWPGSRAISAQKASAANFFSLGGTDAPNFPNGLALSTANLYALTQPGGSLYGLQFSNPQDPEVIYGGSPTTYGKRGDFMVNKRPGGINVFGGGLALYNSSGELIGAIGLSGDTSCADHNIAWKARSILELDYVPAGVAGPPRPDNIIFDIDPVTGKSASGFGHASCSGDNAVDQAIADGLPPTRAPG